MSSACPSGRRAPIAVNVTMRIDFCEFSGGAPQIRPRVHNPENSPDPMTPPPAPAVP